MLDERRINPVLSSPSGRQESDVVASTPFMQHSHPDMTLRKFSIPTGRFRRLSRPVMAQEILEITHQHPDTPSPAASSVPDYDGRSVIKPPSTTELRVVNALLEGRIPAPRAQGSRDTVHVLRVL